LMKSDSSVDPVPAPAEDAPAEDAPEDADAEDADAGNADVDAEEAGGADGAAEAGSGGAAEAGEGVRFLPNNLSKMPMRGGSLPLRNLISDEVRSPLPPLDKRGTGGIASGGSMHQLPCRPAAVNIRAFMSIFNKEGARKRRARRRTGNR
jgi:hypothetical protein